MAWFHASFVGATSCQPYEALYGQPIMNSCGCRAGFGYEYL